MKFRINCVRIPQPKIKWNLTVLVTMTITLKIGRIFTKTYHALDGSHAAPPKISLIIIKNIVTIID